MRSISHGYHLILFTTCRDHAAQPTGNPMTPRQRWLAALQMKPVDRLPFWPKLDRAYPRRQAEPFKDMENSAIHDWIGSDKHVGVGGGIKEVRTVTSVEREDKNGEQHTVYKTRLGETRQVKRFDPGSQSSHPIVFPIQNLEQIRIMTEWYRDARFEVNEKQLEWARHTVEELGEDGSTFSGIGESALMHWVEWLAGIEQSHLLLADYEDEVEELFEAIHQHLLRKLKVLVEVAPADMLYMVENTSTRIISPTQYRRYCVPHLMEYGRIVKESGRFLVFHMCGHLKALLPDLAKMPADAFEAFTSPPLGNTSYLDGRSVCSDKCLVGGTNATLWLESADAIISEIERSLDSLPHHRGLVVTSAGVMPPLCKPETIREVCEWVKKYPARMEIPSKEPAVVATA